MERCKWYIWYKNIWPRSNLKNLHHWLLPGSFFVRFFFGLVDFFSGIWSLTRSLHFFSWKCTNFRIIQACVRQTAPRQPILVRFKILETVRWKFQLTINRLWICTYFIFFSNNLLQKQWKSSTHRKPDLSEGFTQDKMHHTRN